MIKKYSGYLIALYILFLFLTPYSVVVNYSSVFSKLHSSLFGTIGWGFFSQQYKIEYVLKYKQDGVVKYYPPMDEVGFFRSFAFDRLHTNRNYFTPSLIRELERFYPGDMGPSMMLKKEICKTALKSKEIKFTELIINKDTLLTGHADYLKKITDRKKGIEGYTFNCVDYFSNLKRQKQNAK